jgi:two-component system, NarL family, sensor kinase
VSALTGRRPRSVDQRLADLPVLVLATAVLAVVGLGVGGVLTGHTAPDANPAAMPVVLAVGFTPLGVFVLRRRPGHPVGRLMFAAGGVATLAALSISWSSWTPAAWLSQWAWWPPLGTIPVLLLLVPDGRLPSSRWRPLAVALVGSAGIATAALVAAATGEPTTLLSDADRPPGPVVGLLVDVAVLGWIATAVAALGVLAALVVRWRAAGPLERGQLACLLPVLVLLGVAVALDWVDVPYGWVPAAVGLPIGLTLAVLLYRFEDLDLYVHRGVVWLVLSASAVVLYAGSVTVLGAAFTGLGGSVPLLAAAAVAAVLSPAYWLTQRGVRRLLYGRRDEPYAVMSTVGRRARAVGDPLAVLPEIASAVVDGLRVPYAAIRVTADDDHPTTAAEHGRWAGEPVRFPMVAHGRPVGELLAAPRRPGERFTAGEAALLRDLADQAALAAAAGRSAVALQRARDRLVLGREEERRRLRRDLHDGVGSALAGARMLTDVVRRTVADDAAGALLATLAADLEACSAEIRELIDGLRPAALDRGLEPALADLAVRFADRVPVALGTDGLDTELPAAVEVAAYRVVAEALTNVAKHAHAHSAEVTVRRDARHLEVRVSDDGVGFTGAGTGPASMPGSGVGLTSIRSRVDELGGRCAIRSGTSGTTVELLLPLQP